MKKILLSVKQKLYINTLLYIVLLIFMFNIIMFGVVRIMPHMHTSSIDEKRDFIISVMKQSPKAFGLFKYTKDYQSFVHTNNYDSLDYCYIKFTEIGNKTGEVRIVNSEPEQKIIEIGKH